MACALGFEQIVECTFHPAPRTVSVPEAILHSHHFVLVKKQLA
jgi:hypothetical protein